MLQFRKDALMVSQGIEKKDKERERVCFIAVYLTCPGSGGRL